ncbi:hypothetical protein OPV22_034667 [Ensete ventricosum]|uniref:Uncharacterized protein n=1 Tax=Ensete ventricosum TaxID=4639 RepID=A0AAV8P251_ENSVE|nr:hypothetical protein OPV22_034667 [Ensete ventricosum]
MRGTRWEMASTASRSSSSKELANAHDALDMLANCSRITFASTGVHMAADELSAGHSEEGHEEVEVAGADGRGVAKGGVGGGGGDPVADVVGGAEGDEETLGCDALGEAEQRVEVALGS